MSFYASQNMCDILNYITYKLCNPQAAASMGKTVSSKLSNLAYFPYMGRAVENVLVQEKSIRSILIKNYKVYYQVRDDMSEVYILTVSYNRNYHNEMIDELLDALRGGYSLYY